MNTLTWYKGSEEAKSSKMTLYDKKWANRIKNGIEKGGGTAEIVDMGYGNYAVRYDF